MPKFVRSFWVWLVLAIGPTAAWAETLSLPFYEGVIGTIGQNAGKLDNATTYATLGIERASFIQISDNGQYGGTQGNDLSGTLRIARANGEIIDVAGAINWRVTINGQVEYFGFIPDPTNPVQSFTYSGGTYTLDETSNYAIGKIGTTITYTDGQSVSGNAATSGLLDELNAYLAQVRAEAPVITGPSGAAGDAASSTTVNENQTAVATFTANETSTWFTLGGADQSLFSIGSSTGELVFNTAPNYEMPSDADSDNIYHVTIEAQDVDGNTSTQDVSVTVADVAEGGPEPVIDVAKTLTVVAEPIDVVSCDTDAYVAGAEVLAPGSCLEYTITVTSADNGSAPAENIQITDVLPAGINFLVTTASSGFTSVSESAGTVTGTAANLAAGATASFSFRALVQ
jgi:uncharacterized repeat protein (TIGR01451 family)